MMTDNGLRPEHRLTRRQQEIYEHLLDHPTQVPTLEQLCDVLGLSSRGSMHKHIPALIEVGLVEPMDRKQRGVRLANQSLSPPRDDELPLYGYIAAGRPIEALDTGETLDVPPMLRSAKPCYVLQVRGDSMIDEGILDGDYVVVEYRDHARNGEIVVALIDGHEATLKRILQRQEEIVLCPANSTMEAMHYSPGRVAIQGVVVGQMRAYR